MRTIRYQPEHKARVHQQIVNDASIAPPLPWLCATLAGQTLEEFYD